MAFCASLAFVLIKAGVSDTAHMDSATYMRHVRAFLAVSDWCTLMRAGRVLLPVGRWRGGGALPLGATGLAACGCMVPIAALRRRAVAYRQEGGLIRSCCSHACTRRCVVPIAALFAGTLWMGNAAYLYLSVAFIQMIKVRDRPAPVGASARPNLR